MRIVKMNAASGNSRRSRWNLFIITTWFLFYHHHVTARIILDVNSASSTNAASDNNSRKGIRRPRVVENMAPAGTTGSADKANLAPPPPIAAASVVRLDRPFLMKGVMTTTTTTTRVLKDVGWSPATNTETRNNHNIRGSRDGEDGSASRNSIRSKKGYYNYSNRPEKVSHVEMKKQKYQTKGYTKSKKEKSLSKSRPTKAVPDLKGVGKEKSIKRKGSSSYSSSSPSHDSSEKEGEEDEGEEEEKSNAKSTSKSEGGTGGYVVITPNEDGSTTIQYPDGKTLVVEPRKLAAPLPDDDDNELEKQNYHPGATPVPRVIGNIFERATMDFSELKSTAAATKISDLLPQPVIRQSTTINSGFCQLNANGFYGEPIGEVFQVQYVYQVSLQDGVSQAVVETQIAPELDFAIAEGALPYLFDCSRRRSLLQQQQPQHKRDGTRELQQGSNEPKINGLSRLQTDFPILNGAASCVGQAAESDCYVFAGFVSVFAENYFSQEQVDSDVLPAIQLSIQENPLGNSSPLIKEVEYLDEGLETVVPITVPPRTPTQQPVTPPAPVIPPPPPTTLPPQPPSNATTAPGRPTATQPPATLPPADSTSREPEGIEKVPWWGWMLIGFGVAGLALLCYCMFRDDQRVRDHVPDRDDDEKSSSEYEDETEDDGGDHNAPAGAPAMDTARDDYQSPSPADMEEVEEEYDSPGGVDVQYVPPPAPAPAPLDDRFNQSGSAADVVYEQDLQPQAHQNEQEYYEDVEDGEGGEFYEEEDAGNNGQQQQDRVVVEIANDDEYESEEEEYVDDGSGSGSYESYYEEETIVDTINQESSQQTNQGWVNQDSQQTNNQGWGGGGGGF